MYPQYSATTTASSIDAVMDWAKAARHVPEFRFVNRFAGDTGYIQALADTVRKHWQRHGPADKLVVSFHGVPVSMRDAGDPYTTECELTARLLARQLGLRDEQWVLTYQSRFGRVKWVGPATQTIMEALGRAGVRRVDALCPGFVADCLETLEEIAMENRDTFLGSGGQEFHYIPCLNDTPKWIGALADVVENHLQGWLTKVA